MKTSFSFGKTLFLLGLLLFACDGLAAIGVVQFAAGDVQIRDAAGKLRPAKKGEAINEGETILTGAGASAQLRMSDNGILAIRPETELRIDTYKFSGKEDGTERAFMSLVKGGFRTITGIIGRTNKDNYRIGTTTATIGIRGTDHEPHVIPVMASAAGTPIAPPGTYDKVNVGQAYIATSQGSININPNQIGFAPPNQAPRLLPAMPEFFKATPPVRTAQDQKEAEKQKQAAQMKQAAATGNGEKSAGAPVKETDTPATTLAAAPSEVRASSIVDPNALNVPATVTNIAAQSVTTAPPAVTQTITGTTQAGGEGNEIDFTQQTVTDATGSTVAIETFVNSGQSITETPPPPLTPPPPTTPNPAVVSANYGHIIMGQVQASGVAEMLVISSPYSQSTTGSAYLPNKNTDYVLDSSKSLVEIKRAYYSPPYDFNTSATPIYFSDADVKFSGGTASDQASDANNTFYIGRLTGGQIDVTDNATVSPLAPATQPLGAASLHWLIGNDPGNSALTNSLLQPIANTQLLTGKADYTLLAATAPTDSAGNVGKLNSATTTANFSAMTAKTAIDVSFSGARALNLTATSNDAPIKANGFYGWAYPAIFGTSGLLNYGTTNCTGDCPSGGYFASLNGTFGAAPGGTSTGAIGNALGLSYYFYAMSTSTSSTIGFTDLIQGVAILSTGAPPTVGSFMTFGNNANVRGSTIYDTSNSSGTFLALTRNVFSGLSSTTATLSGPTTNTNYLFDANNNLVRIFDTPYVIHDHGSDVPASTSSYSAPTPLPNAQISLGGGAVAHDQFSNNQISMGRWEGGFVNITDLATGQSYLDSLIVPGAIPANRSLAWQVHQEPSSLPISGVYHYSTTRDAAGNLTFATAPTDGYGNVGTIERARLSADFLHQTVSAGVSISIASGPGGTLGTQNLGGHFTDAPISSSLGFNVSSNPAHNPPGTDFFHISCFGSGCAPGQTYGGRIRGGFTSATGGADTADGAFFRYTFNTNYADAATAAANGRVFDDYINGIVAFGQGPQIVQPSSTVIVPGTSGNPPGDAMVVHAYNFVDTPTSNRNQSSSFDVKGNGGYTVDAAGTLRSAAELLGDEQIAVTGGSGATSNVASNGIAYGFVIRPTVSGEDYNGTFSSRQVLDAYHWITGPAAYPWYVSSAMVNPADLAAGTLVGFTQIGGYVTDQNNITGSVTGTLGVNFNAQSVNTSVTANVGAAIFEATANGLTLDTSGSFWAGTGNGAHHGMSLTSAPVGSPTSSSPAFGSLNGALMGPNINGAGLAFNFSSNTGDRATGSLLFGNPTYNNGTTTNAPFSASTLTEYQVLLISSGMNSAGNVTKDNTPFSSGGVLVSEENNHPADIFVVSPSRTQFVSGNGTANNPAGALVKFDGQIPVVSNSCSPTPCNNVNNIGARFAVLDASATGGIGQPNGPLPGNNVSPNPAIPAPTARVIESGYDATTGLRWGRWGGGMMNVGDRASPNQAGPVNGTNQIDVTANNIHYIITSAQSGPVVLPLSGTFTYNLVGATLPTSFTPGQTAASVGALNSASLVANFTNQTVNVGVNASMPTGALGATQVWAASANNVPIVKNVGFMVEKTLNSTTSALNITRAGSAVQTAGTIAGGFAGATGAGAAMAYSLNQGGPAGTTVSGVAAFKRP